ncbi:MAG: GNAT family N-acetyltransferase [Bacilli bacterium]|nr:GNAT family N-acetyltransferase [Bacilli bacterium]
MNVIVRKYKEEDFESVDKILFQTFGYHKENIRDSRVYEFVACLDHTIVGYFNLMEEIDVVLNIKIYHVGYVSIDPQYRGQGFGRQMMEYAIQYAKDNHVARMELTSGNQREVAHKLYHSLGFEKRDTSVFRKEFI